MGGVGGAVPLVSHRLGADYHQHDVAVDKNVHTGDVCILNLSSTEKSGLNLANSDHVLLQKLTTHISTAPCVIAVATSIITKSALRISGR